MPGKSTSGGTSSGPLTRTKVWPNEVSTVRVVDGSGHVFARSS